MRSRTGADTKFDQAQKPIPLAPPRQDFSQKNAKNRQTPPTKANASITPNGFPLTTPKAYRKLARRKTSGPRREPARTLKACRQPYHMNRSSYSTPADSSI